jgi:hypothetical protein
MSAGCVPPARVIAAAINNFFVISWFLLSCISGARLFNAGHGNHVHAARARARQAAERGSWRWRSGLAQGAEGVLQRMLKERANAARSSA